MNADIKKANRYLSNAKEILEEKAGRVNGSYTDKKYVRMAGHTAYTGVLHSLEALIKEPTLKKGKRRSIEVYQEYLGKHDRKMLSEFNDIYLVLHLSLGYDGVLNARIVKDGMTMAKEFIQNVATRVN